jgi:hypothetical protein
MASSAPNEQFVARAAAILTNLEVFTSSFDLNNAWGSRANVQIDFTKGSLTNVIATFLVSQDGVTYYTLMGPTGAVLTQTLTANSTLSIPVMCEGWKYLRLGLTGTGTVTSSSATVTVKYLRRGSQ